MFRLTCALTSAAFLVAPVSAQTTPAVSAQPTVVITTAQPNVLRVGTPIALKLVNGLTTKGKALHVGDRVQMEVAEAIKINDLVVIPVGSPAVGELTMVRNKGMWGKSGAIQGRVLSLNANGRTVRLSGAFDDKGVTGTGAVVGAIAFMPLVGFFTTGTSAQLPAGGIVKGFLDEDITATIQ